MKELAEANWKFMEELTRSMMGSIKTHTPSMMGSIKTYFKASNTTWMNEQVKIDQKDSEEIGYPTKKDVKELLEKIR
jgi:plasmid maintenance system antidote protein VapI